MFRRAFPTLCRAYCWRLWSMANPTTIFKPLVVSPAAVQHVGGHAEGHHRPDLLPGLRPQQQRAALWTCSSQPCSVPNVLSVTDLAALYPVSGHFWRLLMPDPL